MIRVEDRYGDTGVRKAGSEVNVQGNPSAWIQKESVAGMLILDICGDCGHAELRISNYRELYQAYLTSQQGA